MKFTNIEKQSMHQRSSYDELLDSIIHPKDKIDLPDRRATQLRKLQQLSMFDDTSFLDLNDEQENIAKEQTQQLNLNRIINSTNTSAAAVKATQAKPSLPRAVSVPPVKMQAVKRTSLDIPSGPPKVFKTLQTDSASSAADTKVFKPVYTEPSAAAAASSIFLDTSLDESMNSDKVDMEKFMDLLEKSESDKKEAMARHAASSLEGQAAESVVSGLVKSKMSRSRSPPPKRESKKSPPPKKSPPEKPDVEMDAKVVKREGADAGSENKKTKLSSKFPPSLPPPPQPKQSSQASSSAAAASTEHPKQSSEASSSAAAASTEKQRQKPYQKNPETSHPKSRANSLPPPSRANLQIIRDALLNAAHKNKLSREDTATVKLLVEDLKPGSKNSKQANDELRAIYKRYYSSSS